MRHMKLNSVIKTLSHITTMRCISVILRFVVEWAMCGQDMLFEASSIFRDFRYALPTCHHRNRYFCVFCATAIN
ncbi:hypothetical protein Dda3937_04396 [Dickeya dadantii 3937]|uniref:Uncharacterized protein n=1 Tax=Dickeya dadantii (strain 3937) TaxID=198628 RepID=E0SEJ0_DICD3|nr:hypothetical protein Dda3937_04396 [Dickeya dadantii 3937]